MLLLTFLSGLAVFAEEPDTLSRRLEEVSVTAIKSTGAGMAARGAVAATVVSGKEIERLGIVTMKNVSEVAPNFYIPDYGTRMTSSIYVRGIGARIDQPVVGLNVDNVPFLNKDNYDFDLVDIERVEVLRGPQSTLYGRNTMGGSGEYNDPVAAPLQRFPFHGRSRNRDASACVGLGIFRSEQPRCDGRQRECQLSGRLFHQ